MRKTGYRHCKCICILRDAGNWVVVRETKSDCALHCTHCGHTWYMPLKAAQHFRRAIASEQQWRQLKQAAGYHMREPKQETIV